MRHGQQRLNRTFLLYFTYLRNFLSFFSYVALQTYNFAFTILIFFLSRDVIPLMIAQPQGVSGHDDLLSLPLSFFNSFV